MQAKGIGSSLPIDCTPISIASTCYSFNHRRLVYQGRLDVDCALDQRVPIYTDQWIQKNEPPRPIADYINNYM